MVVAGGWVGEGNEVIFVRWYKVSVTRDE